MPRYGMVIDTRKCVGCMDCVVACKTENNVPDGYTRDWITTEVRGKYPTLGMEIRSERCNHCDNPACVINCPTGAIHIDMGGIVLVNDEACTGCKSCGAACPFGAPFYPSTTHTSNKCTFCAHRVREGRDPACVSVCPTHSMHFGDLDDPNSEVSRLLRERPNHVLKPSAGTKPKVFYLT